MGKDQGGGGEEGFRVLASEITAIHAGSADADPAKWRITQAMLEREIEKAWAAKAEHSGEAKISAPRVS